MIEYKTARYEKDNTGQYKRVGDNHYTVSINPDDNMMLFTRNGEIKRIKVEQDKNGFIYDIKKTKIVARGGVSGLYNFLLAEITQNKTGGFALTVFNKVFDYMK